MKPLELTVYPLLEKVGLLAERGYIVNRKPVTFWYVDNYQVFEKRLADAELAAEYHSAWASMLDVPKDERYSYERPRIETLHRFATLPHYDEATL
jgi:hypothetical protein